MSDLDDLRKLDELRKSGRITEQEYASERAWILGGTAQETPEPRAVTGNHVIDLHEIEAAAAAAYTDEAADVTGSAPASGTASGAASITGTTAASAAVSRSASYKRQEERTEESRHRIPTVWKAILIAFLVWILLLATVIVYLRIRNVNQGADAQSITQSAAGTQTQAGSRAAQTAAQELQDHTADATYDAFVSQLETTLGTYYGTNYSITDDGKTLTVSLMGDGIAADAMYVVQGAAGAAEIWSELKASMQTLAVTCFDGANVAAPERHVVLNILNDQNQENVILSYLDGTCIYDATETSDLSE